MSAGALRMRGVLAVALGAACGASHGAASVGSGIYVCTDVNGKRITSDRPIAECLAREQRVLRPDGSTRTVLPPPLTATERQAKEALDREAAVEDAARLDAIRVDRLLLKRYPDEASHRQAREKALDGVRESSDLSKRRMAELASERKAAVAEAEFYKSVAMPAKLRHEIEANEAATTSQRMLIQGQAAEGARVNARFDIELDRLRRLWAGVAPGSLGPLRPPSPPNAAGNTK